MTRFFLWSALGPLLVAIGDLPRPGNFKVIGAGGGGAMFHPKVSPHDLNTFLGNRNMTGAYITHDGGKSWRGTDCGRRFPRGNISWQRVALRSLA